MVVVVVTHLSSALRPWWGAPPLASSPSGELICSLVLFVARMAVDVRRRQAASEVVVGLRPQHADPLGEVAIFACPPLPRAKTEVKRADGETWRDLALALPLRPRLVPQADPANAPGANAHQCPSLAPTAMVRLFLTRGAPMQMHATFW